MQILNLFSALKSPFNIYFIFSFIYLFAFFSFICFYYCFKLFICNIFIFIYEPFYVSEMQLESSFT